MSSPENNEWNSDSGSYRDPSGRIIRKDGRIFRTVTRYGNEPFKAVEATGLLKDLCEKGMLVPWWDVDLNLIGETGGSVLRLLEHKPLRFISYPFEWSFGALKDAALMHLDIQILALEKGVALSDASAYNIQFEGPHPVFIDHLSFKPYKEGEFWSGHRQFCEQFLNPLLLTARLGIPHHSSYRGSMEGIPSSFLAKILPWSSWFNLQILTHILLPSWFDRRSKSNTQVSKDISKKHLPKSGFNNFLLGLRTFISRLKPPEEATVWRDYANNTSYTTGEATRKKAFIQEFCGSVRPAILWDMGCNTGDYSKAALESGAGGVIGFEFDSGALERAYSRARAESLDFLPLHLDAANPTPSQGWNQRERAGLAERRNANGMIALALVHHLAIGRNIPLDQVVEWLVDLAPQGVIEFIPKKDRMVQELLSLREDIFHDYTDQEFDRALAAKAEVVKQITLENTGRRLIWFRRH